MVRRSSGGSGLALSIGTIALSYGLVGCGSDASSPGATGSTGGAAPGGAGPVGTAGTSVTPGAGGGAVGAGGAVTTPGAGGTSVSPPGAGGSVSPPGAGGTGVVPPGSGGAVAAGGASAAGGAGTGGDTGTAGTSGVGCGQGSFCMPGDDLAPPAAADGFQIVSPSSISMAPGQEQFLCYYKTVPGGNVDVGGFRSWMTKGASHHFIVFQGSGGVDGSLQSCAFGSGAWIYATSKSGQIVGMDMPPSVGLPFTTGTSLVMNMHLVNTTSAPINPVIKLNVLIAKNVMYKAAAAYSALSPNLKINVPPLGTQTVNGTCTVPAGSKFFLWTTHTHKYATNVDVNYVSGGQSTLIVNTTDWESPGTHTWGPTDFLTTKAGDSFKYACTYKNPNSFAVTFGETAASNEMCMAIGYFFPAAAFSCN
jgi:hypothetical protein